MSPGFFRLRVQKEGSISVMVCGKTLGREGVLSGRRFGVGPRCLPRPTSTGGPSHVIHTTDSLISYKAVSKVDPDGVLGGTPSVVPLPSSWIRTPLVSVFSDSPSLLGHEGPLLFSGFQILSFRTSVTLGFSWVE